MKHQAKSRKTGKSDSQSFKVSAESRRQILDAHAAERAKNPSGWLDFELPESTVNKIVWLACMTGYPLNECINFILRAHLPAMISEAQAQQARSKWIANAPALKGGAR